jgi:hypothetical protein
MRLDGWKAGKKKPDNMYKHFRNLGLVVVFPGRRGYSFVANDDFYGPFATQQNAQIEAEALAIAVRQMAADSEMPADVFEPVLADSRDEQESTMITKALPQAGQAATEAPAQQYMTRAHWDKLMGYIKQLAASHNALESKVETLTTQVFDLTKVLTGVAEPGTLARAQDRLTAGEVFAALVTDLDRAVAEEVKAAGA